MEGSELECEVALACLRSFHSANPALPSALYISGTVQIVLRHKQTTFGDPLGCDPL